MRVILPAVSVVCGALLASGTAQANFTGIKLVSKFDADNPCLLIANLYLSFSDPGDKALSLNGLIAGLGQPQLFFRTNSLAGFHQETFPFGERNFAINATALDNCAPHYANDTYFNVGIKTGEVTAGGVASGTSEDYSSGTPNGIQFNWIGGGNEVVSDPVTGGAFVLVDNNPPITDQNVAGATPGGNQIFIAQLVINLLSGTNDGGPPAIEVQIGNLIWENSAGTTFLVGFDPDTGLGSPLTQSIHVHTVTGDINCDCVVDAFDLAQLLTDFGTASDASDVNGDGIVNVLDLIEMLLHFGFTCFP